MNPELPERRYRWGLVAVMLALGGLTLWVRLEMTEATEVSYPLRADAGEYYAAAANLQRFGVLSTVAPDDSNRLPDPDAARLPGYPVFIRPWVEYPPTAVMVHRIVTAQAVLGVFTTILVLAALRRLMPLPYALVAAVLTAVSPHLVTADVYVLTESLFTFCVALLLWTFAGLARNQNPWWALAVGGAVGLAALVRETATYLPLFLCIGLFLVFPWRRALRLALLLCLGFVLSFGPWVARNHFNPAIAHNSNQALDSVLGGSYPGLMYNDDPASRGMPHRFDPNNAGFDSWGKLGRKLQAHYAQDPARYVRWYLIGKPMMLLSWDMIGGWGDVYVYPVIRSPYFTDSWFKTMHLILSFLHWPLTVLALVGCLLVWTPSAPETLTPPILTLGRLISLLLLYVILLHMVATPLPRYANPFRPLLFGMALFAVWCLVQGLREIRSGKPTDPKKRTPGSL